MPSRSHGAEEEAEMRLIYRGAEADLFEGLWNGEKAVYKMRKPLAYRLPVLDSALRAQRTLHEAQMIHDARAGGARTPRLYYVDQKNALMVMEYVEGVRLKDVLDGGDAAAAIDLSRELGICAGLLHRSSIMHGDLTTSNAMVNAQGELVLIDFGLAVHTSKVEDDAVDLRLVKETMNGAHPLMAPKAFPALLEGYRSVVGGARFEEVKKNLLDIERRGRYARVE